MCLAIPMELRERDEYSGRVELNGVSRQVALHLFPEAKVGDFLLVHAGYAIGKVDKEEAERTLAYLADAARETEIMEWNARGRKNGTPGPEDSATAEENND